MARRYVCTKVWKGRCAPFAVVFSAFTCVSCQVPTSTDHEPQNAGQDSGVPGCESSGKSDEKNPHCRPAVEVKDFSPWASASVSDAVLVGGEALSAEGTAPANRAKIVKFHGKILVSANTTWVCPGNHMATRAVSRLPVRAPSGRARWQSTAAAGSSWLARASGEVILMIPRSWITSPSSG